MGQSEVNRDIDQISAEETSTSDPARSNLSETTVATIRARCFLGRYVIEQPIGSGGMGEVYRARDTRLERTVAIKMLPREAAADSALRRRFLNEARAASALNHPHIVGIHDICTENDVDFLVMEYVTVKLSKTSSPNNLSPSINWPAWARKWPLL